MRLFKRKQELSIGKKNKQGLGNIRIKSRYRINIDGQRKCYSYKSLKGNIQYFLKESNFFQGLEI